MEISGGFLIVGALMTLAGAILIYQSVKASPDEARAHVDGVVFIGPIPIIVSGSRKWIVAAIGVTVVVIVYLFADSYYPGLMG